MHSNILLAFPSKNKYKFFPKYLIYIFGQVKLLKETSTLYMRSM